MLCPSCGALSEDPCCGNLGSDVSKVQYSLSATETQTHELNMNSASEVQNQPQSKRSTLIEFPGVARPTVPEWRKELSERVREVQERRARDAAAESAELNQQTDSISSAPQLELLAPAEMPTMNPLVAAALKRIERAHQTARPETRQPRNNLATAVAYAPAREENDPELHILASTSQLTLEPEILEIPEIDAQNVELSPTPTVERTHNLTVVPVTDIPEPETKKAEATPPPKRLIVDDPNDPALNYLDSISRTLRVDELESNRPAAFRRLVCALFDLMICAVLTAPIGFAAHMTGNNLQDQRTIIVLAGCLVVVTFMYLTVTTALTGRTWAMRLLSLRVIDLKTGLIPTGGQSIGRSFFYLGSLALAGLGILFALVSREGYTAHDRFTGTAVIGT
jgi:hypothetical protein